VATIGLYGAKAIAIQADLRDVNFGYKVVKAALDGFKVTGVDILGLQKACCAFTYQVVTDTKTHSEQCSSCRNYSFPYGH
jgi:hypothetical protein